MPVGGNPARVGEPTSGRAAGAQASSKPETTMMTATEVLERFTKGARSVISGRRVGTGSSSLDTDAQHAVPLHDAIHDVEPGQHRTEHGVRAVEMRLTGVAQVVLTAAGIGP